MDGLVYWITPGRLLADAAAAILAETAKLLAGNEDNLNKSNSFASDEDLENDKTAIDEL